MGNDMRYVGGALFGFMGLGVGWALMLGVAMWMTEINFYWQAGWNSDLPSPGRPLPPFFPLAGWTDNFRRVAVGWPFELLLTGFMCFCCLNGARKFLWTDTRYSIGKPEDTSVRVRLMTAFMLVFVVAVMLLRK
jgi:amino acid transporter